MTTRPVRRAGVGTRAIAGAFLVVASIVLASALPARGIGTVDGTAASLVGAPVTIACVDLSEQGWWGAAAVGVPHIQLDHDICAVLALSPRLSRGRYLLPSSGAAVLTLAHEAAHVRGVEDEREADCYAMSNLSSTALGLGYRGAQLPVLRAQAHSASTCR